MIKIIKKILIFILFAVLFTGIILNSKLIIQNVIESTNIFIYKLFPSLFPFFILSYFFINNEVSLIYGKFFKKIFHLSETCSFILFLSMISGLPSNAKYINECLEKKLITIKDANNLMCVSYFPNPIYVITTIGILLLNNYIYGIKILISIYISNFILLFILRKKISITNNTYLIKNNSFGYNLKNSIFSSFKTLLLILGNIIIFNIIVLLISNTFNFNYTITSIINSFLEITTGIEKISMLNTKVNIKIVLISIFVMFGGISVLFQSKNILENHKIDFKYILKYRLLGVLINLLVMLCICNL